VSRALKTKDLAPAGLRPARGKRAGTAASDTSDEALMDLLQRLKATDDPAEIRQISAQLERVVFHKQFSNG